MSYANFPDFELLREVPLPEMRAHAREFSHTPSGARLLHLETDDPENCFALAFATPPSSNDGVAHILEHAVLAGSERFPVREPFFEMIKSSPAGFINAMTSDVWTIYPICTTLEGDFFNLAEVYADAVFKPLLSKETFEREGHHLKLETPGDPGSPLVRSGIVYNEMKGAYSAAETVLAWRLKNRLFPGGALGQDAGGDPAEIPGLTWEALRAFHSQFYAPGNCYLFLYGDIPLEKQLAYWGEKLSGQGHAPSLAARPQFEKWTEPRTLHTSFAAEPDSQLTEQTYLSLRWHCGDALDPFQAMSWAVLSGLLSGHHGAPLKKALVASRLGADVLAAGVEDVESELAFHVAVKGSEREREEEFVNFTLRTLEQIAATGFTREEIDTALRQVAYSTLEVHALYPLHLAMHLATYVSCGADPLHGVKAKEVLEEVRAAEAADPDFFPRLIREKLLENPHRLTVVFYPDTAHAEREAERERAGLQQLHGQYSAQELVALDAHAQELEAAQGEPNSPEALATLPRLDRSHLPERPREIPTSVGEEAGFTVLRNEVFSNGVAYLRAAVDISDLPPTLWKFVPRFTEAFDKMGAAGQSWEQIAARRAAVTGGMGASATSFLHAVTGAPTVDLRLGFKTLDMDMDGALDLFGDVVFGLEAGDRARLHDLQTQSLAAYRSSLVDNAVKSAICAAQRGQHPLGWLSSLWFSPLTYAWNRRLTTEFNTHADELIEGIHSIREFLQQKARWTWSFTGSDEAYARLAPRLQEWGDRLRPEPLTAATPRPGSSAWDGAGSLPANVGLAAPLEVNFCALSCPGPEREKEPLVDLGLSLMNFDYLLPEVRFKGNAYGAGASLSTEQRTLTFYSYRDPRLGETLQVFRGAPRWAAAQQWEAEDLERALLGNVGDAVPAIRPEGSTGRALDNYRKGESADKRAERYQRKLAASPEEVKAALAGYLEEAVPAATTAVAASRSNLEKNNQNSSQPLVIQEMLPEEKLPEAAKS